MEYQLITEGSTTFNAPIQDKNTAFPPGTAHVFYNAAMEFNRDITILLLSHISPKNYLDTMAATGVRGLRTSHEVGIPTIINDRDPVCISIIENNVKIIGGNIRVTNEDANRLMCTERFDVIDLDPFGTPIPFLDAASRAARHYLFVTATDTAPLCGAHLKSGVRRYFATPKNTEYHSEVGLRMMMSAMAKELVKYDRGMEPILSFAKNHYFRSHIRVIDSVAAADSTMDQIGFVMQCPTCLYRAEQKGSLIPRPHNCPYCGASTEAIGPLWMGPIQNKEIVANLIEKIPSMRFNTAKQMCKMLCMLVDELETCTFYNYHVISRRLHTSPPAIDDIITSLRDLGYQATRTHFSTIGIKTISPLHIIEEQILSKSK